MLFTLVLIRDLTARESLDSTFYACKLLNLKLVWLFAHKNINSNSALLVIRRKINFVLCCAVMYWALLHCIALYCIVLYCIVLWYNIKKKYNLNDTNQWWRYFSLSYLTFSTIIPLMILFSRSTSWTCFSFLRYRTHNIIRTITRMAASTPRTMRAIAQPASPFDDDWFGA